jgi:hypothetical protein
MEKRDWDTYFADFQTWTDVSDETMKFMSISEDVVPDASIGRGRILEEIMFRRRNFGAEDSFYTYAPD